MTPSSSRLRQPSGAPRPSQWVYSETEGPTGVKTQLWLPADGRRNGLVHPSRGPGQYPACTIVQAEARHCLPDVGYFPDMPTSPKRLFAYLDKVQIASDTARPGEGGSWLANQLAKGVFALMQQSYLRPAQRAALYELMADTPGFTVVPHMRDAIGRVGVAVEWIFEGGRGAVIFEPGTYEFLGVRTWPVASFRGPGAHQYDGEALIKLAVVDRRGQLPNPQPPGCRHTGAAAARQVHPAIRSRLAQVSLSIGIVGLPNVGKSTLFNALTRASALASNYPFATIEPNVGIVGIPDPRLAVLAALYDSARIVPATVRFVDIAGLVRGASQGQGLGNQFLAHIRETDAICQVVRVFADPDVSHVDGDVSPGRDIDTVATELILADLQTLEKAVPRLVKEAKFARNPERQRAADAAAAAQQLLDGGTTLSAGAAGAGIDLADLRDLHLLTAKPFLYVFNMDEAGLADEELRGKLAAQVAPAQVIFLDVKTEAELAELPEDEVAEMAAELGMGEPGLNRLAHAGFRALGLMTFLTAGPKEVRAWEIPVGATAPEAAGVIHTDFQRGFIKAEVVAFDDLVAAGSLTAARAAGKVRIEGKDYVMRDGDVVEFRFNV